MTYDEYRQTKAEFGALFNVIAEKTDKGEVARLLALHDRLKEARAEYYEHKDDAQYEGRNEQA